MNANRIIQKLCSLLLSFILMASIVTCSLRFVSDVEPPKPNKVIIAPWYPNWAQLIIMAGGILKKITGGGRLKPPKN